MFFDSFLNSHKEKNYYLKLLKGIDPERENKMNMINVIPLTTEEEKLNVVVKNGGLFTETHRKTLLRLRNLDAYPRIYGSQTPKGVKYSITTTVKIEDVDSNNKFFNQLARVGVNPEMQSIKEDIIINGFYLVELPIMVMKTKSGKYKILEGRTRFNILVGLGMKNVIVDVFDEMSDADALRFAVSMNAHKKPFGKADFLDIKKAILNLIEFGEIVSQPNTEEGRAILTDSIIYELGLITSKLTDNQVNEIVFSGIEKGTGVSPVNSFPNGKGSQEWLVKNGYVDTREVKYVAISAFVSKTPYVMINNLKKVSSDISEIRFVVNGGVLNAKDPAKDWLTNVLKFDELFRTFENDWIDARLSENSKRNPNLKVKLWGAIPQVLELEDKYPMDTIVKFKFN